MNSLQVKTYDSMLLPTRAHPTDAGLDLKASEHITLKCFMTAPEFIETGVAVKIPAGYVGLVFSRSSFAKHNIGLANGVGVIDADYRGTIKITLINRGFKDYEIKKYDKIAQLVLMPVNLCSVIAWEGSEEDWNDTVRGTGGFGSTGL